MSRFVVGGIFVLCGAAAGWVACHLYGVAFDWGDTILAPLRWKGAAAGGGVAGAAWFLAVLLREGRR